MKETPSKWNDFTISSASSKQWTAPLNKNGLNILLNDFVAPNNWKPFNQPKIKVHINAWYSASHNNIIKTVMTEEEWSWQL